MTETRKGIRVVMQRVGRFWTKGRAGLAGAMMGLSLLAMASSGCSSGGSPTTPSPSSPLPNLTITGFNPTVEAAGAGLLYRTSFTVTETTGRANATITTVTFSLGAGFVSNGNPPSPVKVAAGATIFSGSLNIDDSAGVTAGTTTITVTVGYADDLGRTGSASTTGTVTRR